jgi:hypothetical protein
MRRAVQSLAVSVVVLSTAPFARAEDLVLAEDPEPAPKPQASVDIRAAVGCMRPESRCPERDTVHSLPSLFGIRAGQTAVHGSDTKASLGLVSESAAYLTDHRAGFTARSAHFAMLGGGRAGIEGGLGLGVGLGLYQGLGQNHGPFSRLGGRGFLMGNAAFYASLLELPQLELGYQLFDRDLHLELSAHGGAVLTGRYHPDDERRRLGSAFAWGGLAAARVGPIDLDVDFTRVGASDSDPNGPLDLVSALLCGSVHYFGVCFDTHVFAGDPAGTAFLGLAIGGLSREPPRH